MTTLPPKASHHAPAVAYHALAAGLGGWIFHLFLWRMIWRLFFVLWRIPTVGPFIVGLIAVAVIGLAVLRHRRGGGWRGPWRRRGGVYGYGAGSGPRDW